MLNSFTECDHSIQGISYMVEGGPALMGRKLFNIGSAGLCSTELRYVKSGKEGPFKLGYVRLLLVTLYPMHQSLCKQ
jgi:hypothetical protein